MRFRLIESLMIVCWTVLLSCCWLIAFGWAVAIEVRQKVGRDRKRRVGGRVFSKRRGADVGAVAPG